MNEQELRTLVREAIARHAGSSGQTHPLPMPSASSPIAHSAFASSHAIFAIPSGADAEGPCIIEPAVMCNHCGYCKSMGH